MPLLSRSSSRKKSIDDPGHEPHSNRPSLLQRLSRRSSQDEVKDAIQSKQDVVTKQEPASAALTTSQPTSSLEVEQITDGHEEDRDPANGLSKEDVRTLFFGAPHFMLEKGRHGKAFPQAFFPWNSDLEVSDLQDRRYLRHEAFTTVTLHAHLPIPDEMTWKPSALPQQREEAWKRPMLDLGIFETPNMLSLHGREPGTVGLRFFLEAPISERLRPIAKAQEDEKGYVNSVGHVSANEGLKKEASKSQIGKHAPRQDRLKLIDDGPAAWKGLGIRDVKSKDIIDRIAFLCHLHDEVIEHGLGDTILHKQSCTVLYDELFNKLLFPPSNVKEGEAHKHNRTGLEVQIETLVKVLTTPGAWIDFSLVEPRMRLGQGLWEVPHNDGRTPNTTSLRMGAERKWLFLQILLAIELMVRLDAALRLGSSDAFREFHLTSEEIHHFNKLRNLKVDWDLVLARRFLDMVSLKHSSEVDWQRLRQGNRLSQAQLSSSSKQDMDVQAEDDLCIWNCVILPRRAEMQFEGLLRFARMMNWPYMDDLEANLTKRYRESSISQTEIYSQPILGANSDSEESPALAISPRSLLSGDDWADSVHVRLRPVHERELGGFLGRTWLMGLIMPGDAGCLSVMACLLEQDRQAAKLGSSAFLHAGFVLDRRSFWSKFSIVGRVLAAAKDSTECMGWVNAPQFQPLDDQGRPYENMWLNVVSSKPPRKREGLRINDGQKLADDSSVLGAGRGKVLSSEYGMVTDSVLDHLNSPNIEVNALKLHKKLPSEERECALSAAMLFTIASDNAGPATPRVMQLEYGVGFVSSHPCRPPHGHVSPAHQSEIAQHPHHEAHEHLPAHPLHSSYKFETKSVEDLLEVSAPVAGRELAVWVIDARDASSKDMFARAWCSQIGASALVSRVGKSCLSCSIREAFALEISVIIRVNEGVT